MTLLGHLTEQIGPRLTNSPAMAQANAWSRSKFDEWGLANVHDEGTLDAFGRGWEFRSARVEMLSPRPFPLRALPKAWTPGTNGPVEGEATEAIVAQAIRKLTISKVIAVRPRSDLTVIGKFSPRRDKIVSPIFTGRVGRLGNRDRLVVWRGGCAGKRKLTKNPAIRHPIVESEPVAVIVGRHGRVEGGKERAELKRRTAR